jgi:hypothetical protein
MTREQRSKFVDRARSVGAVLIGVAATPSILDGEVLSALLVVIAGIATFYAGGYMGAIGLVAPLE